ncbi:hypothetical protein SETIT_3G084400v2 [Setaria italica]|uniref:Uncharacterized protein n=1 Tax=Setaria italica TaxID=4555 RepID=A0A368QCV3_SETIT|nr:hypothetical protein SETIT_3G084400v2 [Setaria italica]
MAGAGLQETRGVTVEKERLLLRSPERVAAALRCRGAGPTTPGARVHPTRPCDGAVPDQGRVDQGCTGPAFYAVVIPAASRRSQQQRNNDSGGVKAITTTVPMKHPFFAGVKSVDYLPNALAAVEAEERGAHASVWVDEDGCVTEGPTMNVAFVTAAGDLLDARRVHGEAGARAGAEAGRGRLIRSAGDARIPAGEARRCAEMMLVGSGLPVLPVVEWDGQPVGDGRVGRVSLALSQMLREDMKSGPDRIPVPCS